MNFRYRFRNLESGKITTQIFSFEQIEVAWWSPESKILSRDLGTGMKDKNGKEIFERDRVAIMGHTDLSGVIVFEDGQFQIRWDKDCPRLKFIQGEKEPIFHNSVISLEIIGREEVMIECRNQEQ